MTPKKEVKKAEAPKKEVKPPKPPASKKGGKAAKKVAPPKEVKKAAAPKKEVKPPKPPISKEKTTEKGAAPKGSKKAEALKKEAEPPQLQVAQKKTAVKETLKKELKKAETPKKKAKIPSPGVAPQNLKTVKGPLLKKEPKPIQAVEPHKNKKRIECNVCRKNKISTDCYICKNGICEECGTIFKVILDKSFKRSKITVCKACEEELYDCNICDEIFLAPKKEALGLLQKCYYCDSWCCVKCIEKHTCVSCGKDRFMCRECIKDDSTPIFCVSCNKFVCDDCKIDESDEDTILDDVEPRFYCNECHGDLYFHCSACNETYQCDDTDKFENEGETVCEDCFAKLEKQKDYAKIARTKIKDAPDSLNEPILIKGKKRG